MSLDFGILAVLLVAGFWGAHTGAARQLAQALGLGVAYLCARGLGVYVGRRIAWSAHTPRAVGTALGTLLVFVVVYLLLRALISRALRRLLDGKDTLERPRDRAFGFTLGALKAAAVIYVALCALAFVEDNVALAGRRLGLLPKDSFFFALARNYNLIALTHFSGVWDLVRVVNAAASPADLKKLEKLEAFRALEKDPRFRTALTDQSLRRALETGDWRTLLKNSAVLDLIQDPAQAAHLKQAADHL